MHKVKVGSSEIEVTDAHIYLAPNLLQTYDFVPWNVIRHLLEQENASPVTLIDVGANVGDTLAHFRRFSQDRAICIEPDDQFFDILGRNADQFGDVRLVKSLLVPKSLVGNAQFSSNGQTGSTSQNAAANEAWSGSYITFDDLFGQESGPFIVKTDTDGFDSNIVDALVECMDSMSADVPIIFFEGPSETQMREAAYEPYVAACEKLIDRGYLLLFLTNGGMPYGTASDAPTARAFFTALDVGYRQGFALCHYFDVIAARDDIASAEFRLAAPWDAAFFSRD